MKLQAKTKYNEDGSICRIIEASNGDFTVDLLPYKIQNRELYYDRDHPVNIAPESFQYEKYWGDKLTHYIEGRWIYDVDTWVYIPPKLEFYINYVIIVDEDQRPIKPRLRDNEVLMATYDLCAEGFSGFSLDKEFTCNDVVGKLESIVEQQKRGDSDISYLKPYEQKMLDSSPHVTKEDGTYKKYVNPWIYLTEHYLLTHKADGPLGDAIYENNKSDEMILACRASAKTFYTFGGDFLHEWLTNGQKTVADFKKYGSDKKLFSAGAVRKDQLERSIAVVKNFYNSMPGSYLYGVDNKGKEDKVQGFMYKSTVGTWEVGSKVEHSVKNKDNTDHITGNVIQLPVITPDSLNSFAGGRLTLAIVEEVGFLAYVKRLKSVIYNSLRVGKKKIGRIKYLGTGGDMETIKEPKDMFENPQGYDIFAIPNYYDKNRGGHMALFMSVCMQSEEVKDENGNTVYEVALQDAIEDREEFFKNSDSTAFWEFVSFNPLYPKEMLRPSSKSIMPVVEMGEHRGNLIVSDIWKHRSSVGTFKWDTSEDSKVSWSRDMDNNFIPINDWGKDKELHNREGAWVMYEDVMAGRPEDLYYILYDPAAQGGEGTSLHSALVYKHKFTGGNKSLQETFVAEFIGRKQSLYKNFEEVVRAAMYYNAQILVERNVPGFVEWCESKGYNHLLVNEPTRVLTEVRRQPVKYSGRKGMRTDDKINRWNLTKMADWLSAPVLTDEDGVVLKCRYQNIYSLRFLDEAIHYNPDIKTQFDHMSSALMLMALLLEIDEDVVYIEDEFDELMKNKYSRISSIDYKVKKRSKFLQ